jgi:hypothetical protein
MLRNILFLLILGLSLTQCKQKSTSDTASMGPTGDPVIDGITEEIKQHPDNAQLYLQRAQIFYDHQAYDQAVQDLAQVMKLDSTNLRAHHLARRCLHGQ